MALRHKVNTAANEATVPVKTWYCSPSRAINAGRRRNAPWPDQDGDDRLAVRLIAKAASFCGLEEEQGLRQVWAGLGDLKR